MGTIEGWNRAIDAMDRFLKELYEGGLYDQATIRLMKAYITGLRLEIEDVTGNEDER